MKTSNKLLVTGAGIAILIPILMFLSFKKGIDKQRYHLVKDSGMIQEKISIRQPKVLKLRSRYKALTCNIHFSPTANYQYFNNTDSIQIQESGDTLLVSYGTPRLQLVNEVYYYAPVDIYLPQIPTIIAEGATVAISEFGRDINSPADITLFNDAKLELGTSGRPQVLTDTIIEKSKPYFKDHINYQTSLFDRLKITAMNSEVNIGPYAGIRSLDLALKGNSRFMVAPTAAIEQLKGSISDKSLFSASSKHFAMRDSLQNTPD